MTASTFAADYAAARTLFRDAAAAAAAQLDEHRYPEPGPSGEALFTDVAWIGCTNATKVLVTACGTHGVEGFCGSGAQVDWLSRGEAKLLPKDTAAMLVHAINPYGFAWLRRVTHENVDLNRNWIDFGAPLPANPAYGEIAAALCPTEWSGESQARTFAELKAYIDTHGFAAFVQAASGGQHTHPNGIFFGGTGPAAARRTLAAILTERLGSAEHVAIVDLHSGLGPSGYGERIIAAIEGSADCARARSWYGGNIQTIGKQGSAFAKIAGDWLSAAPQLLPKSTVTAIALEFGTVEPLSVLSALRADNWLHAHGDPRGPAAPAIKAQVLAAFYTSTDVWRGMILGQSLATCRQAIAGLQC